MAEIVFTNARIVLADQVIVGTVAVENGLIADVSTGASSLPGAIDCEGDYLIPGLVELHTDNLERHMMPRPKTSWPSRAAAINHDREVVSAGITTVYNALSIGHIRPTGTADGLEAMLEAVRSQGEAGALKAEHRLHLRCEVSGCDVLTLLEPLVDDPLVGLVSIMDHTPGQRQFASIEAYATYYQGKYGLSDQGLDAFIAERLEDHARYAERHRHIVVEMARERGIALASHDDATPEHVAEAVRDGVTIAEFPTTLAAAKACHEGGLAVLMGGPNVVRGGSHSGNVAARALAEAGRLDILSSDYVPASLLYGALLLAETTEAIEIADAVAMISRIPARQLGLDDRGEIAPAKRADLVRFLWSDAGPVIREVWREGRRVA